MAISAKDVMKLRKRTGLGMMECKQALTQADGDIDQAIDFLRTKGLAKMDNRADRTSAEGRITVSITADQSKGAIVEVNTETDFTADNDSFKSLVDQLVSDALEQGPGEVQKTDAMQGAIDEVRLTTKENVQFHRGQVMGGQAGSKVGSYVHFTGKVGVLIELDTGDGQASDELLADLCMHIAAANPVPIAVNDDEVPAKLLDKERQIARAQAEESGKPEQIIEKIVEGKVRKFLEDHVLLKQAFIKDDKKRIGSLLPAGVVIKSFVRYQVG